MLLSYKPFKKEFHHLKWEVPMIVESCRQNLYIKTRKVKVLIGLMAVDVHTATAEQTIAIQFVYLLSWLPAEVKTGHSFTKLSLCTPVISIHRHACHQLKTNTERAGGKTYHKEWLWIANMQTMFVKFILIYKMAENITKFQKTVHKQRQPTT